MMTPPVPPTTTAMTRTDTVAKSKWLRRRNGTTRWSSTATRMAKMRRIKPIVDSIRKAGSVENQGSTLRAVNDHRDLAAACQVASINSLNDAVTTAMYVCQQSTRMIGCACHNKNFVGKHLRISEMLLRQL